MQFCANGSDWTQAWEDDGFNRCFFDSTTSVILFVFIFIGGIIQTGVYSKYASYTTEQTRCLSWLHIIQVLLTVLLIVEAVLHMILSDVYISPQNLLGNQILQACALTAAFIVSLWLMAMERRSMLPRNPTRGQGIVLILFWGLHFVHENLMFVSWNNSGWWWQLAEESETAELTLFIIRYVTSLTLLLTAILKPPQLSYIHLRDQESQTQDADTKSTWSNLVIKTKLMLPYMWPKQSLPLQVIVCLCLVLLVLGRVINVFVPIYNKNIVNSLTYEQDSPGQTLKFRWDFILIYAALLFLKGGSPGTSGFINNLRSLLWIRVQQYSTREIQLKLFTHLHNLSLRWHIGKKTGEMLRVVERGTNSINTLLSYFLFQILPTIADIVIAIVYFVLVFNYLFGTIVFTCMVIYLAATIKVTEWRTKYRRQRNRRDNEANARAVDSLLNFETVKYYAASEYERQRYQEAINEYQLLEWKFNAVFNLISLTQNIINTSGLAAGSLLCAYTVVYGINDLQLDVGDYVLFGTYLSQLYGPLNSLGNTYRMVQQALIDMENMFELLDEEMEVKDIEGAKDLVVTGGQIEFDNVTFCYEPSKTTLKNVSFTMPPGQTYALVGHTGSGKSTVVRLLFRFYDIHSGCIKIDGQDISQVTQQSLRACIGVVPQDTVLFNNDIRYNIRYGRQGATNEEVEEAAKAAEIHDRIMTFPKQYDTLVGERGLRLSGGEKQRVAIARTLLKAPAVVLLDEATSALDTRTERSIQTSLARVCENRTTITVAHRLSTIIHAHRILVLHEGEVVEAGTHEELLKLSGYYADMWQQQLIKQDEPPEVEDLEEMAIPRRLHEIIRDGGGTRGFNRGRGKRNLRNIQEDNAQDNKPENQDNDSVNSLNITKDDGVFP